MNKKNGFTLIEVIAVILIIGVVMLVAIPSVMDYIQSSDNEAYATNAMSYIETARAEYSMEEYGDLLDSDEIMIVPIKNIVLEKSDGGESPYGLYDYDKCYIIIVPERNGYQFYVTMVDANGIGINNKGTNQLNQDAVNENIADSVVPWNMYVNPDFPLVFNGVSYKFYEQRDIEKDTEVIPNGVIVLSSSVTSPATPSGGRKTIRVNFYTKAGIFINSQSFTAGEDNYRKFKVGGKDQNDYSYGNALSTDPNGTTQMFGVNNYVNDGWIEMVYDSSSTHTINLYTIWVNKSYNITMPGGSKKTINIYGNSMAQSSYRESINSAFSGSSGTYYYCSGEIQDGRYVRVLKSITASQATNKFFDIFYDNSYTESGGFGSSAILYNNPSTRCM